LPHDRLFRRVPALRFLPVCAALALTLAGCQAHSGTDPAGTARSAGPDALFVDVSQAAGIHYRWQIPGRRPLNILQTIGNGCAFLDYDNDGNLDILLVGPKLALYRGDGHGHFTDVTHATGLDRLSGHFLGCAVGDYDNDGYPDIYLSAYRGGALLHNEAAGKSATSRSIRLFRDVTRETGIAPQPWGTSCGFVESVPGSGLLDLYLCNYAVFGPTGVPQLCEENGVLTSCGPRSYTPLKGVFYRSDGHGRFHDATRETGLMSALGRGLGVAFADYTGSGRPGIAIANDEMPGDLLQPASRGPQPKYTNCRESSGTAYDRNGNVHGGMGADWGDYDNDGRLDLFVATFQNEAKSLYHNDGNGEFSDLSVPAGIGVPTTRYVAFGCKFLDYDNDGWLDLIVVNGHVQDNIKAVDPSTTYRQPCQLFHNLGGAPARFEEVRQKAGPDLQRPIVGRGLAVGDYDNDGREDVLIVDAEGAPLLLHNQTPHAGHWLGVRLIGTRSNRDGYGAQLTLEVGGQKLLRQCQSCGSYLSASDPRVHFGLGSAAVADTLTVRWPSGLTGVYRRLPADRYITLREGDATVR
jgi:hypothetical protein